MRFPKIRRPIRLCDCETCGGVARFCSVCTKQIDTRKEMWTLEHATDVSIHFLCDPQHADFIKEYAK